MAAEYGSGGGGRQRRPVADDRQLQHYMEDPDLAATSIITELVSLEDHFVPYSGEEMESELCAPLESSFASSIGEGMYARFPPNTEMPPTKMKGKKRGKTEEKEKEVKKRGDKKGAHSLSEHIASAHPDFDGKLFPCDMCDKSYRHSARLRAHKQTKHNAPLKFKRKKGEASSSASTSINQGTSLGEPATEGVRDAICDGDDVIGETEGNGDVIVENEWWRATYELSASEEEIKQKVLNLLSMKDKLAAADICGQLFKDWQEKAMRDYPDLCEVIVKHGLIFGPLPKLHEEVDKQIRQSQAKQTPRKTLKKTSKINDQELACPECEFRTRTVSTWVHHLRRIHHTTPILAGLALLCACGQELFSTDHVYKCDVANVTIIRKRDGPIKRLNGDKETPQCVLCKVYPKTAYGFVQHLHIYHKTTLKEHNIYLKCVCGLECHQALNTEQSSRHRKECLHSGRLFTLHKLDEK